MQIVDLPMLWYEDKDGKEFIPDPSKSGLDVPDGFIYQHSIMPLMLPHTMIGPDGKVIARMECGWPEDLAMALATTGKFRLSKAIMIAAHACERCMNALAHQYGLGWGYPENSVDWHRAGTLCKFCKEGDGDARDYGDASG